ncbi:MAG: cytochrome c oxidase assembly protein [Corynebacterium glucuronolyticum]|nr:cytochrome c oxidase assembly protein [Mycobacteriaceae bacterium]MDY5833339.1 cytochrome c oxidase assembly protein [Corynebacterium glucuronolyticum]
MKARRSLPVYTVFVVVAGIIGVIVSTVFLAQSLAAMGIPDPGPATTAGLPFFRAAGLMLACLGVGNYLLAAFFIHPQERTELSTTGLTVDGVIAVRTGSWAMLSWALVAAFMIPLYLSDVSGEPLTKTIQPAMWSVAIDQVSTSFAFEWVAIFAFITGAAGLFVRRWLPTPFLLVGAILTIVPLGLEGHSATGGNHDYGTNSYLWHLLFLVLWVGGLMALIGHTRRRGLELDLAVKRFSPMALVAIIAMAATGLINAGIRLHFMDWFTSGYGLVLVGKTILILVCGVLGYLHRERTMPYLKEKPELFNRIAIVEVIVMAVITGLAVSLGRTPPPPPRMVDINSMDILIGYRLEIPTTFWNVWTMWRFDLMFGTIAIVLAATYLWNVRKHSYWPWQRTMWYMIGCAMLFLTMCSGIGMYIPASFSMHMVGHMILSMGVPVFWVLGGPLTLIKETHKGEDVEYIIDALVHCRLMRILMHPGLNTIQFVVVYYILYLTPLYEYLVWEHAGHLGMNVVFILSGTLYYWQLIGVDDHPHAHKSMHNLWWLMISLPFHMYFGVYLMQLGEVLALDFYNALQLPWNPDLLWDQRVGGGIAWAAGQFPLIIVFGALLWRWFTEDKKEQAEYEEQAIIDDDADLRAYNEYLEKMHRGEVPDAEYFSKEIKK